MGRGPGETFFQRTYTDWPAAHEKILSISNPREMQIETPMKHHFTHVRMATVKKTTNKKC